MNPLVELYVAFIAHGIKARWPWVSNEEAVRQARVVMLQHEAEQPSALGILNLIDEAVELAPKGDA